MKNERRCWGSVVLYRALYINVYHNMYFARAFKDGVHVPHIESVLKITYDNFLCDKEFPFLKFLILSRP